MAHNSGKNNNIPFKTYSSQDLTSVSWITMMMRLIKWLHEYFCAFQFVFYKISRIYMTIARVNHFLPILFVRRAQLTEDLSPCWLLSCQCGSWLALTSSLLSECRVTNVGNLELKDLRVSPTFLPTWSYSDQFVSCPGSSPAHSLTGCM